MVRFKPLALDALLEDLVSKDPHGVSHKTLSRLLNDSQATGGAIIVDAEDRPRLWLALNVEDAQVVLQHWDKTLKALSVSGVVKSNGYTAATLRAAGGTVGVLYLEGATRFELAQHADYLTVLSRAIVAATTTHLPHTIEGWFEGRGNDASVRALTLDALQKYKWNITKTAQSLGVERRTIYMRLRRWGVALPASRRA